MSPIFEDRLAKIREQLNAGQAISLDDSRLLLLSVDRMQRALRDLLARRQRTIDELQGEVDRLRRELGQ